MLAQCGMLCALLIGGRWETFDGDSGHANGCSNASRLWFRATSDACAIPLPARLQTPPQVASASRCILFKMPGMGAELPPALAAFLKDPMWTVLVQVRSPDCLPDL